MARLYAESFAPWCEKARWALDHHRIEYSYTEHVPLIGDLALRIAARRPFGRVTVPLLVDGDEVLMDSSAIARHAEARGSSTPLFPDAHVRTIGAWDERSERVMTSGRAMLLPRMRERPEALREQLPPLVPAALRSALRPLASTGVAHLMRKYGVRAGEDDAHHLAVSRAELDELRATLARGPFVLGDVFSFADVTMATALQFVLPVAEEHIALGPATREAWTHAALASEYADLLAWRDALYRTHRAPSLVSG